MSSQGIGELRNQLLEVWRNLGRGQQIAVAGIGAISVVVIIVLVSWATTPEYGTLYSNLAEADAAAVAAKLKESKIPYELANGGATIRVPSRLLYETRLQLASAGLPQRGGVGFEVFNQTNFGMTDFIQKVNYQRALEGELARTIGHLGPVEQARVHLVNPQPALYTDDEKPATASVVLTLKPGQKIKEAQVRGIAQLVSSSVEGLALENVTIVDAGGNVLSASLADKNDPLRTSSSQMETEKAFETDLEQRVQGMLDRVVGYGKTTVRARALFDWNQYEATSEIFSPDDREPQVRSSHDSIERSGGTVDEVGGTPGVRANIPIYAGIVTDTASTQGQYERRDTTTNYEVSKTLEKTSKSAGTIKKLSVAVVLDDAAPLSDEQINEVTKLVTAAAGIDASRGDVLTVSRMPYAKNDLGDLTALEEAQQWDRYLEAGKIAAMILGPLLLLVILVRATRGTRASQSYSTLQLPRGTRPELGARMAAPALASGAAMAPVLADLPIEDSQQRFIKDQVSLLARGKPEVMAELIKTWLEEDGSSNGSAGAR